MRVEVIKPHGFCSGVRAAVEMARHALSVHGEVWCLHELVHNGTVVDEIKEGGMRFVESLEDVPEGGTVLFSAHGVPPGVRALAEAFMNSLRQMTARTSALTAVSIPAAVKAAAAAAAPSPFPAREPICV